MEGSKWSESTAGLVSMTMAMTLAFLFLTSGAGADVYTFSGEDGVSYFTNVPGEGRKKVQFRLPKDTQAVGRTVRPAIAARADSSFYDPLIVHTGRQFSVDPDLIRAVIKAESNYNPQAVSPKGARGLMQLMPFTARELGVADPFDPAGNVEGGVRYLRSLLDTFDGNYALALAAYNAGPSRVLSKGDIPAIPETQSYVRQVLEHLRRLKQ
jgi:soluble lytic murein transglycosylase-like protein